MYPNQRFRRYPLPHRNRPCRRRCPRPIRNRPCRRPNIGFPFFPVGFPLSKLCWKGTNKLWQFICQSLFHLYYHLQNGYVKKRKTPCNLLQGVVIPKEGVFTPSQDPQKQGISANAEKSSTTFGATQNFMEQLLTVFDKLEAAEQEQLIQLLTARVKATV